MKFLAANAAIQHLKPNIVLGVGTGTTVNFFIEALAEAEISLKAIVSSSLQTTALLEKSQLKVSELNNVDGIDIYVDGADEVNDHLQMIKGGGGALTREKVLASASKHFICIADKTKWVNLLGKFPVAVEVLPMARSFVAREIVKLGGLPEYRQGFVTDNDNLILDVRHLPLLNPNEMERKLNNIPGVVCCGIFAERTADILLLANKDGVQTIHPR